VSQERTCRYCSHYRSSPELHGYCERIRRALVRNDRGTAGRAADFQVKKTDTCSRFKPWPAPAAGA
jgi:hypothetical protein